MDSWGIKCCILSDLYVKNNSLFWGVLLQKASVLMESGWKEPLILSDTMHALSSVILFYPAWALFFSFNSCIKIKNLCLLFFFCLFSRPFLKFYLNTILFSFGLIYDFLVFPITIFPKSPILFLPLFGPCFLVLSIAADWYAKHSALQTLRVCCWLREWRPAIWLTGWVVINDAGTAWRMKHCK